MHEAEGKLILPFRKVIPDEKDKYKTCLPLFSLKAAAGGFGTAQEVKPDAWVEISTAKKLQPGMFVAHVVGKSMEPTIPDGSWCLFKSPVEGSRSGRIVLVQNREIHDPETGGSFTVKRYKSMKQGDAAGTWRHVEIQLLPDNPEFQKIVLKANEDNEVAVIAEFIEVMKKF
ncbi:MAG: S24 family peptidase [Candidatus Binatia bacterium]